MSERASTISSSSELPLDKIVIPMTYQDYSKVFDGMEFYGILSDNFKSMLWLVKTYAIINLLVCNQIGTMDLILVETKFVENGMIKKSFSFGISRSMSEAYFWSSKSN